MGQQVHPYGFRLGITTDHRSQWFSDSNKPGERYADYVAEDVTLRRFLQEKLDRAGVSHMVIRRTRDRVVVDVHVARPGVAIGRQGTGLDKLRDDARELAGKTVIINVIDALNPAADPPLLAQVIAEQGPPGCPACRCQGCSHPGVGSSRWC